MKRLRIAVLLLASIVCVGRTEPASDAGRVYKYAVQKPVDIEYHIRDTCASQLVFRVVEFMRLAGFPVRACAVMSNDTTTTSIANGEHTIRVRCEGTSATNLMTRYVIVGVAATSVSLRAAAGQCIGAAELNDSSDLLNWPYGIPMDRSKDGLYVHTHLPFLKEVYVDCAQSVGGFLQDEHLMCLVANAAGHRSFRPEASGALSNNVVSTNRPR